MLFKEWKTVRIKFFLWVAVYVGALGLFIIEHGGLGLGNDFSIPIFVQWQGISTLIMALIAALGGVDLVADEKANGTLSFLLTKPVSRTRIYLSKLGINILALAVTFLPVNIVVLVIDQLNPTGISDLARYSAACRQENAVESCLAIIRATAESSNLWQAIAVIGMILLFGIGIICLTGLISIFARNTMQAILFTPPALIAFVVIVAISVVFSDRSNGVDNGLFNSISLTTPLLLLCLGGSFFYIGLHFFRTKEF